MSRLKIVRFDTAADIDSNFFPKTPLGIAHCNSIDRGNNSYQPRDILNFETEAPKVWFQVQYRLAQRARELRRNGYVPNARSHQILALRLS